MVNLIYRGYSIETQSNGMVWVMKDGARVGPEWCNDEDAQDWIDKEKRKAAQEEK